MFDKEIELSAHIELSDKCNARCIMCGRNYIDLNNSNELSFKPNLQTGELYLEDYINIFDNEFYNTFNLTKINFCGNRSDPIITKDFFEIIKFCYFKNKNTTISISTNGSLKPKKWWYNLGKLMSPFSHKVTFGIDGLADTHFIHRPNTDFNKIISNAESFIKGGGKAVWQFIIFKNNQHQIEEAKELAKNIGFIDFFTLFTPRFAWFKNDYVKYKFKNKEYVLEETTLDKELKTEDLRKKIWMSYRTGDRSKNEWKPKNEAGTINCSALEKNEFFLDFNGNVFPCCWLGGSLNKLKSPVDISPDNIIHMYDEENMNAIDGNLTEILKNSEWFNQLKKHWGVSPCRTCANFCGSTNTYPSNKKANFKQKRYYNLND